MLDLLLEFQTDFPDMISNSRGRGYFIAFDLPDTATRDSVTKIAYDKQLLILGCGERSIRFRPYLTTEKAEIDEGMNILLEIIKSL